MLLLRCCFALFSLVFLQQLRDIGVNWIPSLLKTLLKLVYIVLMSSNEKLWPWSVNKNQKLRLLLPLSPPACQLPSPLLTLPLFYRSDESASGEVYCPLRGDTYLSKPATFSCRFFKYVWPFRRHQAIKG